MKSGGNGSPPRGCSARERAHQGTASRPLRLGMSNRISVLGVVEGHMGDTYRAVYTVKIAERIYVLHCFQKKSTKRIETPKQDVDLIRERLKAAQAHAKGA